MRINLKCFIRSLNGKYPSISSIKLLNEEKTKRINKKKNTKSKIKISEIERLYTCVFLGEEGGLATTGLSLDEL